VVVVEVTEAAVETAAEVTEAAVEIVAVVMAEAAMAAEAVIEVATAAEAVEIGTVADAMAVVAVTEAAEALNQVMEEKIEISARGVIPEQAEEDQVDSNKKSGLLTFTAHFFLIFFFFSKYANYNLSFYTFVITILKEN
jgi:hypothetical protein